VIRRTACPVPPSAQNGETVTKLTPFSVNTGGLLPRLIQVIAEWEPGALGHERAYHRSLEEFLRERNPDATIEREYRHLGTTVDLYVEYSPLWARIWGEKREAFIEIKRDLKRKSDYDRLVGQIEDLDPGRNIILVILCGDTAPQWLTRLKERYRDAIEDELFRERTLAIIEK